MGTSSSSTLSKRGVDASCPPPKTGSRRSHRDDGTPRRPRPRGSVRQSDGQGFTSTTSQDLAVETFAVPPLASPTTGKSSLSHSSGTSEDTGVPQTQVCPLESSRDLRPPDPLLTGVLTSSSGERPGQDG